MFAYASSSKFYIYFSPYFVVWGPCPEVALCYCGSLKGTLWQLEDFDFQGKEFDF